MKQRPAFTLIELIVALVLSTFVLVAIVGITAQMLRYEFEGTRKSVSTNWSTAAQDAIKKDLSSASVLYCPSASGINHTGLGGAGCTQVTSQVLSGCANYTFNPAASVPTPTRGTTAFHYCVWCGGALPDNCATPTKTPWLLRYELTTTPPTYTCPMALPNCGTTPNYTVVAQDIYLNAGNTWFFKRDDAVSGVEVQFMVGIGTAALAGTLLNTAIPTAQRASFRVSMNKSYGNSLD